MPTLRHKSATCSVAGGLGDLDRRDIARARQRPSQRDRTVVLVIVVAGLIVLVLVQERRWFVGDDRRRRQVGPSVSERLLEGGKIDERLEDRAGLPPGADHAIELRLVVGASADPGEDLAGSRVDRDQRRLRRPELAAAPLEQVVHLRQATAHRVLRQPLQMQVERRVDVDARDPDVHRSRLQILRDVVDEIRSLGFERPRVGDERLGHRLIGDLRGDEAFVAHRAEDDVAALRAAFERTERRVDLRQLDDAGERCGFAERHVDHILAEVDARGFAHAMDGEGSTLAQIDLVQVQLEDLVLAETLCRPRPP